MEPEKSLGVGPKSIKKAFDDVNATNAKEVVLAYLDFDKFFEIYTDASTKQLGSVITQSIGLVRFSAGNYLYNSRNIVSQKLNYWP
jgi:hypothetical protein